MKSLLDHCVTGKTRVLLEKAGFATIALKELGKASAPDSEVLAIAKSREAILLTCDLEFGNVLIYPPGSHSGIILLRISQATENQVHSLLLKALAEIDPSLLSRSLVVIDKNKYRVRR